MNCVRGKYRMHALNTGSVRMKPIFFGKIQFFFQEIWEKPGFQKPYKFVGSGGSRYEKH